MVTGIGGFYPERVGQDLKWNRVLNLQGKAGGNMSLDLLTELMVREFKGQRKHDSAIKLTSTINGLLLTLACNPTLR